jgi:hypothetical protein
MPFLKAVNNEKTSNEYGEIISTNKIGVNKGLSLEDFTEAVKNQQCYSFIVEEL